MQDHTVVVGGSVAGLITALALARGGRRVTVLEKDAMPLPATPDEAFQGWQRRGAPQVLQSHAFLGRMHNLIRDREPALLEALLAAGAEQLTFRAQAAQHFDDPVFEPSDDDIVLLACRRVTLEWVLRQHVLATKLVEVRDGEEAVRLVARDVGNGESGIPRVTGVELKDGEVLACDRVVDASGRRSKLSDWLEEIGAPRMREKRQACGIFYATRFYRLHEGVERPRPEGIIGGDLGYVKCGIFPGDAGSFSITLAAAPDDDPMRAVLRNEGFDRVARAIPLAWEWINPETSAAITDVHGMANLWNTRRYFVEDGEPLALGLIPIGDALIHANPLTGRGCSLAWSAAYALADALDKHGDDARAVILTLSDVIERELAPWLEMQIRQDQDAIDVNRALRRGEDPYSPERPDGSVDPKAYMRSVLREGLGPAMRQDLGLMRRFSRVGHMLDEPREMLREPEVMQKVMAAYETRHEREPVVLGPSRNEMLEILAAP